MANRCTKITFPVFNGFEVRVISAKDVARTGRRLKEDLTNTVAALITKEDRPGFAWLVLTQAITPGEIAHEASHAVREVFKFAGVKEDDESFAYHLEYLVQRIHKFLKKAK